MLGWAGLLSACHPVAAPILQLGFSPMYREPDTTSRGWEAFVNCVHAGAGEPYTAVEGWVSREAWGLCRWDMMECGAGFTFDADTNLTGPEAVRFTFQAAASNGLTLVRTFGHGHDAYRSIVLQPRAGV